MHGRGAAGVWAVFVRLVSEFGNLGCLVGVVVGKGRKWGEQERMVYTGENCREDWFGFVIGEDSVGEEGLDEGPVCVAVDHGF